MSEKRAIEVFGELEAWIREKYPIDPSLETLRDTIGKLLSAHPGAPIELELDQVTAAAICRALARLSVQRMQLESCTARLRDVARAEAEFRRTRGGEKNALIAVKALGFCDGEEWCAGGRDLLEMLSNYRELTEENPYHIEKEIVALGAPRPGAPGRTETISDAPLSHADAVARLATFYDLKPSAIVKYLTEARSRVKLKFKADDPDFGDLATVTIPSGRTARPSR